MRSDSKRAAQSRLLALLAAALLPTPAAAATNQQGQFPTAVVLVAIAAAASCLVLWWRHERARFDRQRSAAEAERKDLVHRIEELVRRTGDMQLLIDADLNVIEANEQASEVLGYGREELLRLNVRDLRDPTTLSDLDSRIEQERAAGKVVFETRYRRKDGSTFPVEVSARVLEIDGKTYHQGTFRDISDRKRAEEEHQRDVTERKRAEEALQASEAKFRAAFHGAGMGIMLFDRDGRITDCNRALATMLGYEDPEELRNRTWTEILHPEHLEQARGFFQEMLEGKRDSVTGERRYRRKDGAWADAILRGAAIRGPAGEFIYAIAVVEDVTQKKVMEARLLLADRMSSMGTLAAGVAHEINNPLAFIVANLSCALDELRRPTGRADDAARALEEALEGSARVREIVRDLRTFSRPDETQTGPVDVRQVLKSSMNLAQNEIHHRARLNLDLQNVPVVTASPHRLGQVFLNLLINAAQAIPEGRVDQNEIRVATRSMGDGRILIEIADSGSGIAPENLSRVFEPFFTTKPVGVGTGLGLSICHGIVTSLGGEIRVQSSPGKGSTFQVFLPAAIARPAAASTAEPAPTPGARGRILVVDDEAMVGSAIRRVLSPTHEVVALTSPREALSQLLENGGFDLVLCDLMMPEMTGMELYKKLASAAPALSRRVVFLTGGAFTPDASEFLARVPNARVEKPFDPQALRALVGGLVSPGSGAAASGEGKP